jgi:uncharacterized protein YecA (UPF0149 family)
LQAAAAGMSPDQLLGRFDVDTPEVVPPAEAAMQPRRVEKTPGRNDPCYCGSGKKYKLCHGR